MNSPEISRIHFTDFMLVIRKPGFCFNLLSSQYFHLWDRLLKGICCSCPSSILEPSGICRRGTWTSLPRSYTGQERSGKGSTGLTSFSSTGLGQKGWADAEVVMHTCMLLHLAALEIQ